MKKMLMSVLGQALAIASLALADPSLEFIRDVGDTLGGANYIEAMVYDRATDDVYVAGECIIVVDCETDQKVGRLPFWASRLGSSPIHAKVYAAGDSLRVLDAATRQVTATLGYDVDGEAIPVFAYDSIDDKMYFIPDHRVDSVIVIDGASDSVLGSIHTDRYPFALAYNPVRNKLYCANLGPGNVTVIDCASDSVIALIDLAGGAVGYCPICYVTNGDKVYCGSDGIEVIDCGSDSIVAQIDINAPWCLTYNPTENKLYCLSDEYEDYFYSIDCSSDSILGRIYVPDPHADLWGLSFNPTANKVYAVSYPNNLTVVDCYSDSIVAMIKVGLTNWVVPMTHSPPNDKVYCGNAQSGTVTVIDGATDSIVASVVTSDSRLVGLCYNRVTERVYCTHEWSPKLTPIDPQFIRVLRPRSVGVRLGDLVSVDSTGKMYCVDAYAGGLSVLIDDTVVGRVAHPAGLDSPFLIVSERGRLYCRLGDTALAVVDIATDSVVAEIGVGRWFGTMVFNPIQGYIYTTRWNQVIVVDGQGDSVLARLDMPGGMTGIGFSSTQNRLYCLGDSGGVYVVDGATSTLDTVITAPPGEGPVFWSPANDNIYYVASEDLLVILDCETDQLVGFHQIGNSTGFFGYDSAMNRLYISCSRGVSVIDCNTNTLFPWIGINESDMGQMAWVPQYRRMFVVAGGTLLAVLRDPVGIGTATRPERVPLHDLTVCRGVLLLSGEREAQLLDIAGRRVVELQPGENDIRHVAPGVYFVREEGPRNPGSKGSSVRKIVIQR